MWIRRQTLVQARMPSMRPQGHGAQRRQLPPAPPANSTTTPADPAAASSEETRDEAAARAGGFHESSYELQHGLQVSESDWPEDVTVPGALGER